MYLKCGAYNNIRNFLIAFIYMLTIDTLYTFLLCWIYFRFAVGNCITGSGICFSQTCLPSFMAASQAPNLKQKNHAKFTLG